MNETNEVNSESNHTENNGTLPPAVGESSLRAEKKRMNGFQRFMTIILLGILLVAVGAGAVYFWLYQPEHAARLETQVELDQTTSTLATTQSDLEFAQGDITSLETDLDSVSAQQAASERVAFALGAYAEVSSARVALANDDSVSARISLANADSYLAQLGPFIEDTEIASGLNDRLMSARSHLSAEPETAAEELGTLAGNLLNLIQGYLAGN